MLAIVLALVAASCWGVAAVLIRVGLRDVPTRTGTVISLVTGLVFIGLLVSIFQFSDLIHVSRNAILLFALIGVLQFPMGRFFNYTAMSHLGVSGSTPLAASAPLFAVILAVAFTGESVNLATAAGIALIAGGLFTVVTARGR